MTVWMGPRLTVFAPACSSPERMAALEHDYRQRCSSRDPAARHHLPPYVGGGLPAAISERVGGGGAPRIPCRGPSQKTASLVWMARPFHGSDACAGHLAASPPGGNARSAPGAARAHHVGLLDQITEQVVQITLLGPGSQRYGVVPGIDIIAVSSRLKAFSPFLGQARRAEHSLWNDSSRLTRPLEAFSRDHCQNASPAFVVLLRSYCRADSRLHPLVHRPVSGSSKSAWCVFCCICLLASIRLPSISLPIEAGHSCARIRTRAGSRSHRADQRSSGAVLSSAHV